MARGARTREFIAGVWRALKLSFGPYRPLPPITETQGFKLTRTLADIGLVAGAWSSLERVIDYTIWRIAGIDKRTGACLTSQIQSVRSKLITLEALCTLKNLGDEKTKSIRQFINKTEGPSRSRNRAVHNPLFITDDGFGFSRVQIDRNKLVFDNETIKEGELMALARDIEKLVDEFTEIFPIDDDVPPATSP